MADLFYETRRTPLNSVAPRIIPRVRIARVPVVCGAGGTRALPAYIEVVWWQWRWHAWLGPRTESDLRRFDSGVVDGTARGKGE